MNSESVYQVVPSCWNFILIIYKGCGLFFETLADISFLNGNPISRVIDTYNCMSGSYYPRHGLPLKNEISANVSKNKPQPLYYTALQKKHNCGFYVLFKLY